MNSPHISMKSYNKLVRDKIVESLEARNIPYKAHIADEDEYRLKLREKLQEEVDEYLRDGEVGELADVLEVVHALSRKEGVSPEELERVRTRKAAEKGAFEKRVILEES